MTPSEQLATLRDDNHQINTALAKLAIQLATLATDFSTRLARLEERVSSQTPPT